MVVLEVHFRPMSIPLALIVVVSLLLYKNLYQLVHLVVSPLLQECLLIAMSILSCLCQPVASWVMWGHVVVVCVLELAVKKCT